MSKPMLLAICIVVMIAIIVSLDFFVFKDHFLARLFANVGIVLVFIALYLRFF